MSLAVGSVAVGCLPRIQCLPLAIYLAMWCLIVIKAWWYQGRGLYITPTPVPSAKEATLRDISLDKYPMMMTIHLFEYGI